LVAHTQGAIRFESDKCVDFFFRQKGVQIQMTIAHWIKLHHYFVSPAEFDMWTTAFQCPLDFWIKKYSQLNFILKK
jgi:hypothetical protein